MGSVRELLVPLAEVDDRGIHCGDEFVSWRDHIRAGAVLAATLRARLDPSRPPHIGVLLGNTPFFSTVLVAAGLTGLVPVGLNPTRRGAALARDIARADCQLVLSDSADAVPDGVDHIDVESPAWAEELASHADAPVSFADLGPDDLFMLIFTSGTSGEPKAVHVTHDKVAWPGQMLAERFGLGPADTCYLSMPLFHSNAVMAGWAVAVAARCSIALRRKFSASQFIPDVRRYGATYANYVGKPLSYILATPQRDDDADNPLRILYGNEGAPRDLDRFAQRFGVVVVDGFGSTEGGVSIARTPDTPDGALGPLTDEVGDPRRRHRRAVPARQGRRTGQPEGPGTGFAGTTTTRRPKANGWPAACTTAAIWPTAMRPATSTSPDGSATGCASTARTWAPRRSSESCCAIPILSKPRSMPSPTPPSAIG